MSALAARLPLVLLPALLFVALFHPATLDIGNAGWLIRGTDNGENALGLHAYLHDPRAGLSPRTTMLNAPDGVALLFTDSNPLVALAARPFAAWLPADAQLVGPWLLLCLVLQVAFAWLLLRRHAPDALSLWLGVALLAALPTLMNRYIHANLFAHWLILAALWLFADRARGRSAAAWTLLLAVTALVHSYLLVMVAAIWGSATLMTLARARGVAERGRVVAGMALTLAVVAGVALWLGAGGRFAVTGTYGYFAMPLDALWNPANPGYGTLLPAIEQREGRGLEGFQYLGLGILLLLPVAAVAAWRCPPREGEDGVLRRLGWLVPAYVVLTLLAISHYPDAAGHKLLRLPMPPAIEPVVDLVRASGRLFWPVAYTLVFAALVLAFRLPARSARLCLIAAATIQVLDTAGIAEAVRATSAGAAQRQTYALTHDPRWDAMIAEADDVAFVPADPDANLALFQEVAWRAAKLGRPVRSVYAARKPLATERRVAMEDAAFAAGRLAPRRLYVLLKPQPAPAGVAARAVVLDGVTVVRAIR